MRRSKRGGPDAIYKEARKGRIVSPGYAKKHKSTTYRMNLKKRCS